MSSLEVNDDLLAPIEPIDPSVYTEMTFVNRVLQDLGKLLSSISDCPVRNWHHHEDTSPERKRHTLAFTTGRPGIQAFDKGQTFVDRVLTARASLYAYWALPNPQIPSIIDLCTDEMSSMRLLHRFQNPMDPYTALEYRIFQQKMCEIYDRFDELARKLRIRGEPPAPPVVPPPELYTLLEPHPVGSIFTTGDIFGTPQPANVTLFTDPVPVPVAPPVQSTVKEIIALLTGYINANQDTIIKVVEAAKAVQSLLKPTTVNVTSSNTKVRNPAF